MDGLHGKRTFLSLHSMPMASDSGQTQSPFWPMSSATTQPRRLTMATLRKELELKTPASRAWDALADFHAVDKRVAPGFLTQSQADGDARVVTFANGTVAREMLVSSDDASQRLVYAISNERLKHYNAAVQVFAEGDARCRFVWTVDILPNEMAGYIGTQMDAALQVIKPTLEGLG
jgi:hypothetical protein